MNEEQDQKVRLPTLAPAWTSKVPAPLTKVCGRLTTTALFQVVEPVAR